MAIGKKLAISLLSKNGDSIMEANGHEPFLCTTDFSNKYIRRVRRSRSDRFESLRGKILLFNWNTMKFDAINTKDIWRITPLATILANEADTYGQQEPR